MTYFDVAREALARKGEADPALALTKILWEAGNEAMRMHYQAGVRCEIVDVWYKAESRRILLEAGLI